MNAAQITQLLSGIHGDPNELKPLTRYKVTMRFSSNVRSTPTAWAANLVKTVQAGYVEETEKADEKDSSGNTWIRLKDGYVCTKWYGLVRATVEVIQE